MINEILILFEYKDQTIYIKMNKSLWIYYYFSFSVEFFSLGFFIKTKVFGAKIVLNFYQSSGSVYIIAKAIRSSLSFILGDKYVTMFN